MKHWTILLALLLLVGCGGGGGSSSENSSTASAAAATPLPTVSLNTNLSAIEIDDVVDIYWSTSNATSCTASGAWSGSKGTSGSENITIESLGTNTFTLACTGAGGNRTVSVTVNGLSPYTKIEDMDFNSTIDHLGVIRMYRDWSIDRLNSGYSWNTYFLGPWTYASNLQVALTLNQSVQVSLAADYNDEIDESETSEEVKALDWSVDWYFIDDSDSYPVEGILADYLHTSEFTECLQDLDSLTQVEQEFRTVSFYTDTGPEFLGTEYVTPTLSQMNYHTNCSSAEDTNRNVEVIASVLGSMTKTNHIPNSGVVTYKIKALAWLDDSEYKYSSNDNSEDIYQLIGVEGDGSLTIDHEADVVTGYFNFDHALTHTGSESSWTLGSISLSGGYTYNGVNGLATLGGEFGGGSDDFGGGSFEAMYFGPDGNEIGGAIYTRDNVDDRLEFLSVSFVGAIEEE